MLYQTIRYINNGEPLDQVTLNRHKVDIQTNLEEIINRLESYEDEMNGEVSPVPNTIALRDDKGTTEFAEPYKDHNPLRLMDSSVDSDRDSIVMRDEEGSARFGDPSHPENPYRVKDASTDANPDSVVIRDENGTSKFDSPVEDQHPLRLDDITTSLTSTDDTKVLAASTARIIMPSGVIVMWSGSIGSIPEGWSLCNGSNGTPDLRNRFVVGAGSSYSPGNTGGADSVTLSISQMPSHNHSGNINLTLRGRTAEGTGINSTGNIQIRSGASSQLRNVSSSSVGSSSISSQGGGQSHENRPPYYALAYIMKD